MTRMIIVIVLIITVAGLVGAAEVAAKKNRPTFRPASIKTPRGELPIFPADNPWNQDVSELPVHERSRVWIAAIGVDKPLHPDIGTTYEGRPIGIPYVLVPGRQKKVAVKFEYANESDAGPYPISADPPIEGGPNAPLDSDRHILMIDYDNKKLYELFHAIKTAEGWTAGSGAIFDLTSNKRRPAGWTSADAAGLPIFPGLVRYDEVNDDQMIRHALRFTVRKTQRGYIAPATHWASRSSDPDLPPMGLRVRLRQDFDLSKAPPTARVILEGLKRYGMLLADNGGDWFITGAADPRWNDEELQWMRNVKGRDLECVDTGPVVIRN